VRVTLQDSRALASMSVHPSRAHALPVLGPDPLSKASTAEGLAAALHGRRSSIKSALLDQRVLAGVGNIYAVEALWRARIDPRMHAGALGRVRLRRLLSAVARVLRDGLRRAGRYRDGESRDRMAAYGRDGAPCRRCGAPIRRISQTGRSTWFCPRCQRA
jgi:formamidopyrimidine-DNA glycosylase